MKPKADRPKKPTRQITISNPSQAIIEQMASDLREACNNEINRTLSRAMSFLNEEKRGAKQFRSAQLIITVEKP